MRLIILFLLSINLKAQCPFLNLGLDLNLPCNDSCISIQPNYFITKETNTYLVSSIPYSPLSYTLGTLYNIPIDDRWSGIINLPFNFSFFNTCYSQYVLGTNGIISFNTTYANNYCPWPFTSLIPTKST